jgi:chromate transporter
MMRMKPTNKQLFQTFFKVGAFTIGGGYAMIPVIEAELVNKQHWLTTDEFYDAVSVAQAIPGIIAVHMAMYMGFKLGGIKGAAISMLGVILPSFVMILGIASLFMRLDSINPLVTSAFAGVRVSVVALIVYAGYTLFLSSANAWKALIAIAIFALVYLTSINPFFVIIGVVFLAFVLPQGGQVHANH